MKIAILGFGRRISEVLQNLEKSFEAINEPLDIVGYYDVQEKYYQDKDVRRFEAPQELLNTVKPEGVLIGSPTDSHLEYIKLAMDSAGRKFSQKSLRCWIGSKRVSLWNIYRTRTAMI